MINNQKIFNKKQKTNHLFNKIMNKLNKITNMQKN